MNPCAAARFAVGLADRLLAVYLVQFVRLAAKRLVGKSLQLRKKYAGLLLNSIKHTKSIQLRGVGSKFSLVRPLKPRPRPHPRLHRLTITIIYALCMDTAGVAVIRSAACVVATLHERAPWTTPTFREILVRPWPDWPERFLRPCNLKQNLILGKVATLGPQSLTFMRQPTYM